MNRQVSARITGCISPLRPSPTLHHSSQQLLRVRYGRSTLSHALRRRPAGSVVSSLAGRSRGGSRGRSPGPGQRETLHQRVGGEARRRTNGGTTHGRANGIRV